MEPVSLIVTVRNEERVIDALLDSIFAGRRVPDEVVVVDGGSRDGTLDRLRARAAGDPRLRPLSHVGNIAAGRNAAVRAARHGLIACTDAGVRVDPSWLERLTARFASSPGTDVVGGFYESVGEGAFERAAAVVSAPRLEEVDRARFLPSARSLAFRRAAWAAVGGFDESLDFGEDTAFAIALRRAGRGVEFEPGALVRWRPRGDLGSFARQFVRYGRGDGSARIQGRFYATLGAKYALAVALLAIGTRAPAAWWALGAGAAAFAVLQSRRGRGRTRLHEAVLLVPALKIVYDLALLCGYARGRVRPPASRSPARAIPPASD